MEVVIVGGPEAAGTLVGGAIADLVGRRPDAVLGLATGSSPLAVYRDLARRHAAGELSLARARAFLLDEYVGLPAEHPQRYRAFIARELERHVDLAPGAVRGPDVGVDGPPCSPPARPTSRRSAPPAASTCSSSASAATATSASTSPGRRWRRAPASRR